ncbi:hypothetical protein ABC374_26840, partial [Peribacillus sp. 1P06PB]
MNIAEMIQEGAKQKTIPQKIGNFIAHEFLLDGGLPELQARKPDFRELAIQFLSTHKSHYGVRHFDPYLTENCIVEGIERYMRTKHEKHLEKYYGRDIAEDYAIWALEKGLLPTKNIASYKQRRFLLVLVSKLTECFADYYKGEGAETLPKLKPIVLFFDFLGMSECNDLIDKLNSARNLRKKWTAKELKLASKVHIMKQGYTLADFLNGAELEALKHRQAIYKDYEEKARPFRERKIK